MDLKEIQDILTKARELLIDFQAFSQCDPETLKKLLNDLENAEQLLKDIADYAMNVYTWMEW